MSAKSGKDPENPNNKPPTERSLRAICYKERSTRDAKGRIKATENKFVGIAEAIPAGVMIAETFERICIRLEQRQYYDPNYAVKATESILLQLNF